MEYSIEDNDDK